MTQPAASTAQRFTAARRSISQQLLDFVVDLFLNLGSWRDEDVTRFQDQALPTLRAAQQTLGNLTAAYIAEALSQEAGRRIPPATLSPADVTNLRRGVDEAEVYRRPFVRLYTGLSRGDRMRDSIEAGSVRLAELAETDLQMTHATAANRALKAAPADVEPVAWRRVLQGPASCGLCVIASTQRYLVEQLNPIHPGCDCTVEPLFAHGAAVLDRDLLERLHDAVFDLTGQADRGGRAIDYRDLMVSTVQTHGEVGAVLVRPRDRFSRPQGIDVDERALLLADQ